jgi:hypothetical protein
MKQVPCWRPTVLQWPLNLAVIWCFLLGASEPTHVHVFKRKNCIEYPESTRWFKYDRDKLWLVYTQIVPVIFEPPCNRRHSTECVQPSRRLAHVYSGHSDCHKDSRMVVSCVTAIPPYLMHLALNSAFKQYTFPSYKTLQTWRHCESL